MDGPIPPYITLPVVQAQADDHPSDAGQTLIDRQHFIVYRHSVLSSGTCARWHLFRGFGSTMDREWMRFGYISTDRFPQSQDPNSRRLIATAAADLSPPDSQLMI